MRADRTAILAVVTAACCFIPACTSTAPSRLEQASSVVADMNGRVGRIIPDPDRATDVRTRLAEWKQLVADLERIDVAYQSMLTTLNADPLITRAEVDDAVRPFDRQRREIMIRILDERDALIALTTPEEWAALGGTP
jgi:hypothetical protein